MHIVDNNSDDSDDSSQTPTVFQDAPDCPRCGTDHTDLPFYRLGNPIRIGNTELKWYATCPNTSGPILMTHVGKGGSAE